MLAWIFIIMYVSSGMSSYEIIHPFADKYSEYLSHSDIP